MTEPERDSDPKTQWEKDPVPEWDPMDQVYISAHIAIVMVVAMLCGLIGTSLHLWWNHV